MRKVEEVIYGIIKEVGPIHIDDAAMLIKWVDGTHLKTAKSDIKIWCSPKVNKPFYLKGSQVCITDAPIEVKEHEEYLEDFRRVIIINSKYQR